MMPVFGTSAVLIAPPAAIYLNGYAVGNTLPAQTFDYILHSITSEIDNVLSAASITPNGALYNQLATAIASLISTSAATKAPLPQTGVGVGQVVAINPAQGVAAVLPANGMWEYFIEQFAGTGVWVGPSTTLESIAAGGTTIGVASAGNYWAGRAERIA